jgi:hypothetical protein
MSAEGVLVTCAPDVAFKLVAGDHEKLFAPDAFNTIEVPEHTLVERDESTITRLVLTVMVNVSVAVHPFEVVPVTV